MSAKRKAKKRSVTVAVYKWAYAWICVDEEPDVAVFSTRRSAEDFRDRDMKVGAKCGPIVRFRIEVPL